MIIRILTEGQFNLPGIHIDTLNEIDNEIVALVAQGDDPGFKKLLAKMLDLVRASGTEIPVDELVESDLGLPQPDITLNEAAEMFVGEGLVPD